MLRPIECEERRHSFKSMNREKEFITYQDLDIRDKKVIDNFKYIRRRTSFMVSMSNINVTVVDIYKMLDTGLKIARFRMSSRSVADRIKLLKKIEKACQMACDKYNIHSWSLALDIELKSCTVKTGIIARDRKYIEIQTDKSVILTNDIAYKTECSDEIIYVGNGSLTQEVKVGAEINLINAREITMECTEVIDKHSIRCKVTRGGFLTDGCIMCVRGAEINRPFLAEHDLEILQFALDYNVDIITMSYVRSVDSLNEIKNFFKDRGHSVPVIFSSITTEEGLRNIDEIIKASDGIIIAREFLTYELPRPKHLRIPQIQKWIIAKCNQVGKPVYLSGGLFQEGLRRGDFNYGEVSDVANAVIDGVSGFQLKCYENIELTVVSMKLMDDICRSAEPFRMNHANFWRMVQEIRMPINAAQAAAMACVAAARQTQAAAIILPTVSGKSLASLLYFQPPSLLLVCCSHPDVSRRLRIYPNTVPLVCPPELLKNKQYAEGVEIMVLMAIEYAVRRSFLVYGDYYITFMRGHETASYLDTVKIWKTVLQRKNAIECPDTPDENDFTKE